MYLINSSILIILYTYISIFETGFYVVQSNMNSRDNAMIQAMEGSSSTTNTMMVRNIYLNLILYSTTCYCYRCTIFI